MMIRPSRDNDTQPPDPAAVATTAAACPQILCAVTPVRFKRQTIFLQQKRVGRQQRIAQFTDAEAAGPAAFSAEDYIVVRTLPPE